MKSTITTAVATLGALALFASVSASAGGMSGCSGAKHIQTTQAPADGKAPLVAGTPKSAKSSTATDAAN